MYEGEGNDEKMVSRGPKNGPFTALLKMKTVLGGVTKMQKVKKLVKIICNY